MRNKGAINGRYIWHHNLYGRPILGQVHGIEVSSVEFVSAHIKRTSRTSSSAHIALSEEIKESLGVRSIRWTACFRSINVGYEAGMDSESVAWRVYRRRRFDDRSSKPVNLSQRNSQENGLFGSVHSTAR